MEAAAVEGGAEMACGAVALGVGVVIEGRDTVTIGGVVVTMA